MNSTVGLLNFITYLVNNRGILVSEVAEEMGWSVGETLAALNRIMMIGLPPYDPNDYLSFGEVKSGDCRIRIDYGSHFDKPVNLTPAEAMALRCAIQLARANADDGTLKALERLDGVLRHALPGGSTGNSRAFVAPQRAARTRQRLAALAAACEDRVKVRIEYFSAHRNSLDERTVHPFEVIEFGAHLYLFGWCEVASATRHFRIDRIRELKLTDEVSKRKPPKRRNPGRMKSIFDGEPTELLEVKFVPELAEEIADEWEDAPGTKVDILKDGSAVLKTPLYNRFWAIGYLMSFGDQATLMKPRGLRTQFNTTLQRTLQAHKG